MKYLKRFLLIGVCLFSFSAAADENPFSEHTSARSLFFHGGLMNAFNGSIREGMYGLEYRHRKFSQWGLVPAIGYIKSNAGAEYLYGDMKYTFALNEHWGILVSTGMGFFKDSKLLDLGHTIEFKSGIELFYQFNNRHRLGLSFNHYSNSRLSKRNPGTESLTFGYTVPF